jgi:2-oxoglutarate ferredoxin oxidoreductase subunit alpha
MRLNILFGGKAGEGSNVISQILGKALVKRGYYVFCSRDYQSLIRGGHNFNVLTVSDSLTASNDSQIDAMVALDEYTEMKHKKILKKNGVIFKDSKGNMHYLGKLFKALGLDFKILEEELKELEKRFEENIIEATEGYEEEKSKIGDFPELKNRGAAFMNGSVAVANGALASGLDIYYAYPMTPATAVLTELAEKQFEISIIALELENEIAVINAAIGSSMTGAKAMLGTSGGGFDLMTEGLSLAGIADIPLVIYLSQRPGPATGVPTYTGQGDLDIALHAGHGEFPRLVVAPGDPKEAHELTTQAFYLSQKFKLPAIILSDKHLAESFYTVMEKPATTRSEKLNSFGRYNSYEKDETGSMTEEPEIINKNIEKRFEKKEKLSKEAEKFSKYKFYGTKNSKNVIVSWGSTKGAILDAIKELNVKFIQILYLEPFADIKKEIEGKNIILIENNAAAPLGNLVAEKTGIIIEDKNKILRYDGRPFLADELKREIEKRVR